MGQIDVTDLLSDPDFADSIGIIHRTSTINSLGENIVCEQNSCSVGVVQPVSGKTLLRLPEDLRIQDIRSFWVKGIIVADGKNKYPDILVFKGQRYAVQMVFDWTNFGDGYTEGVCVREAPSR